MPTAAQTTATPSTAPISVTVLMSASRRSPADRFPAARQLFLDLHQRLGQLGAGLPTRRLLLLLGELLVARIANLRLRSTRSRFEALALALRTSLAPRG